jgi:hypothetical protein
MRKPPTCRLQSRREGAGDRASPSTLEPEGRHTMPMLRTPKNTALARNTWKTQPDFKRIHVALGLAGVAHVATEGAEESSIRIGRVTLHFFGWAHKRTPLAYRFTWEYQEERR